MVVRRSRILNQGHAMATATIQSHHLQSQTTGSTPQSPWGPRSERYRLYIIYTKVTRLSGSRRRLFGKSPGGFGAFLSHLYRREAASSFVAQQKTLTYLSAFEEKKLCYEKNCDTHRSFPLCSASVGLVAKWHVPAPSQVQGWRLRNTVIPFSFAL